MLGLISQNGDFYSKDASLRKKSWFQISGKSVKPIGYMKRLCNIAIAYSPIPCCISLVMVTITRHFINIFQTVHFSAVKFTRGNEKKNKQLEQAPLNSEIKSMAISRFKHHLSMASTSR